MVFHIYSVYHGGSRQSKRNSLIQNSLIHFSVAEWKPTLAIAGRSLKKLQDMLEWVEASPADVPIILADVDDPASLQKMCQRTKLVLNCVGPFRWVSNLPSLLRLKNTGSDVIFCFISEWIVTEADPGSDPGSRIRFANPIRKLMHGSDRRPRHPCLLPEGLV